MTPNEMQERVLQATRNRTRFIFSLVNKEFFKIDVPKTKTNYKIAVLFSGGLRNFDVTMDWANKFLIDPLNADIFFHGWCNKNGLENNEELIKGYHNLKTCKILDRTKVILPVPEILKSKFPDCVRRNLGMELADHILGQLFNIRNSFDLMESYEKKNNIKYDLAIRARPDVFWYATFKDEDLNYIANNNCLATPQHYMSTICGDRINDQFAMARTEIMKRYTRMFDMIETYAQFVPNDEATEFYVNHHVRHTMRDIPLHNIDMTFMLDYPIDYQVEKGFTNSTMRHKEQNDSIVAQAVVNDILKTIN